MSDITPDSWTEVDLGKVVIFANVNYRGNVIVTTNPFDADCKRKELLPDLEYGRVIVV